ncbi:MAG TPA: 1-deoxy-D-xylulose-5-phosphate reductoisomerase [Bryobacteraceae bacterium]|nr:1-deoxy-D-xylulose-5-phosphate reductoisomerase [Bryobacteraceae bacterium]
MPRLTVLGSTGSIGVNTLDVIRQNSHQYKVYALAAGRNVTRLAEQIVEFRPGVAVVPDEENRAKLCERLTQSGLAKSDWPELLFGPQALVAIATASEAQIVVSAIVGVAGLEATYEAVRAGKRVGLANKEVLVSGGRLVMDAVRVSGAELIPIDSEHNGAHQCLRGGNRAEVTRLILTASGGPFRMTPIDQLAWVTPEDALKHPTWKMGNRITIDSATLMNKGFEVIEACWLFSFTPAQVDVVIHPQSSVHAMIEYSDGSVIAQISATDMRMPIQYALTYPERTQAPVPKIDWSEARRWEFGPPDLAKFPLLKLAYECQAAGGSATCTLNAADEVAVEAFLARQISFPTIYRIVEQTVSKMAKGQSATINDILEVDRESRSLARELVAKEAAVNAGSRVTAKA